MTKFFYSRLKTKVIRLWRPGTSNGQPSLENKIIITRDIDKRAEKLPEYTKNAVAFLH